MNREIMREVSAISRLVTAMREKGFSKYGLKRGQHAFLTRIVENIGISQKELSELLRVDKGTTAKAIKKLVEEGYVYREKSKVNHKAFELYPTEKGRELYPVLVKEVKRTGDIALIGVDEDTLYRELKKMRENLDNNWELEK